MEKIVVRIRPVEVMDDLSLELIRRRATRLAPWDADVRDTRLSDATYVTVIAQIPQADRPALARLQSAFADLPRMRALLWLGPECEVPVAGADVADLVEAGRSGS